MRLRIRGPFVGVGPATQLLTDKLGMGDVQMVIVVSAPDGADGGAARAVGTELVDDLMRSQHVESVTSAWTAPDPERAALISNDGRSGLIVAESQAMKARHSNTRRSCRTASSTTGTA